MRSCTHFRKGKRIVNVFLFRGGAWRLVLGLLLAIYADCLAPFADVFFFFFFLGVYVCSSVMHSTHTHTHTHIPAVCIPIYLKVAYKNDAFTYHFAFRMQDS